MGIPRFHICRARIPGELLRGLDDIDIPGQLDKFPAPIIFQLGKPPVMSCFFFRVRR